MRKVLVLTVLALTISGVLHATDAPTTAPTITLPTGSGNGTTPVFSWSAVDTATTFALWTDNLTSATSQVIHETALTDTTFTPTTPLTDNNSFRVWVRAGNDGGWGPWSNPTDFATGNAPVSAPTGTPSITDPSGTGNTTTPTVAWTDTGDSYFDLWIDDLTSGASQVVRQTQVVGTSFTPTTPLTDNHSYRAYVRAGNVFGFGPWSAAHDFGTGTAPTAAPTTAPSITAPTGSGNTTTPTLTWTAVAASAYTDVWIDDQTTGTSQVVRNQQAPGTSLTLTTALIDAHSYRAYVRAGNVFGYGPWSNPQDFGVGTAPVAPPTTAPTFTAPTGSGNGTTPTFVWNNVADASYFDIWVDSVTSGQSQVIRSQQVVGTTFTPTTAIADNSSYRAYVRAGNAFGYGPWSSAQVFATGTGAVTAPTGTPNITAPIGTGNTTTPTVTWTTVAGSDYFDLWIDDLTSATSQVVRQQQVAGTTFTPTTALSDNHSFRAYVRAGNNFGYGPWSAPQDFGTGTAPTTAPTGSPTITAPTGAGNATTPTFTWTAVDGSGYYDIWVDSVTTGESQVIRNTNVAALTFTPTTAIADNASYRAYVRAGNVFGYGPWSAPQVFATGTGSVAAPATAPTVTAPTGTGNTTTPSFTWTTVAGSSFTDLWVDDLTSNTSQIIRQPQLAGTTFTPTTAIPDNHSFRTYVRAGNGFGYGPWSEGIAFGTGTGPITAPTGVPVIAQPTGINVSLVPTFSWSTVSNSTLYDLWVDDLTANTSQVIRQQALVTNSFVPTSALTTQHSYRTYVRAGNIFGFGGWSAPVDFTTVATLITITPPANIVAEATGATGAAVSYAAATVSDPADATPTVTYSIQSGSVFPIGTTTVMINVVDGAGGAANSAFSVTVQDTTAPTIAPIADISKTATSPAGAVVTYSVDASDTVTAHPTIQSSNPSGNIFPIGVTTVTVSATDGSNNSSTTTFKVTVTADTIPPVIAPLTDVEVLATSSAGSVVNYLAASATDNSGVAPTIIYSQNSGTVFPIGTTVVTVTATDLSGNAATSSFSVTVLAIIPPTNVVAEAQGPGGATVSYLPATIADFVTGVTYSQDSGTVFPIGTTPVLISGSDIDGTVYTASFNVTVSDTTPPVIPALQDITLQADTYGGAHAVYPQIVATDLVTATPTISFSPAPGSTLNIGSTLIQVTASDNVGNKSYATFHALVTDVFPPEITPPDDFTLEATSATGAVAIYPAPTITDPISTQGIQPVYSPEQGSTLPIGTNLVTVSVTNAAGLSAQATFHVTVLDSTPPVVDQLADIQILATDKTGAVVQYPFATASDTVSAQPTITYSQNSGTLFPIGTTVVTVSATDGAGNTGTSTFNVVVGVVSQVSDVVVEATDFNGAIATYPAVTTAPFIDTVQYDPPNNSQFPLGSTPVTITALSAPDGGAGNRSVDSYTSKFNVKVQDTTGPVITPIPDFTVNKNGPDGAIVVFPNPTVTDNTTANPAISYDPPDQSFLRLGTTKVTVTAVDLFNNPSAPSTFNVTVVDAPLPPPDPNSPPTIPTLIAPIGNIANGTPVFQWTNVPGANKYDLWIANLSSHSTTIRTTISDNNYTPVGSFPAGTYSWFVRAGNDLGFGRWAQAVQFVVPLPTDSGGGPGGSSNPLPSEVHAMAPLGSGPQSGNLRPTFLVNGGLNATTFFITVWDITSNSNQSVPVAEFSFPAPKPVPNQLSIPWPTIFGQSPPPLRAGHQYMYEVVAANGVGSTSDGSDPFGDVIGSFGFPDTLEFSDGSVPIDFVQDILFDRSQNNSVTLGGSFFTNGSSISVKTSVNVAPLGATNIVKIPDSGVWDGKINGQMVPAGQYTVYHSIYKIDGPTPVFWRTVLSTVEVTGPAPIEVHIDSTLNVCSGSITGSFTTHGTPIDPSKARAFIDNAPVNIAVSGNNFAIAHPPAGNHTIKVTVQNSIDQPGWRPAFTYTGTSGVSIPTGPVPVPAALVTPADGSFIGDRTPFINVTNADKLLINGIQPVGGPGSWAIIPESQMADGLYTLVTISNISCPVTKTFKFTIDATPPVISAVLPVMGTVSFDGKPTFSATFADATSGIDISKSKVFLDGTEITSSAGLTTTGFSYTPAQALSAGVHVLDVYAADKAGNLADAHTGVSVPSPLGIILDQAKGSNIYLGELMKGQDPADVLLSGYLAGNATTLTATSPTIQNIAVNFAVGRPAFTVKLPAISSTGIYALTLAATDSTGATVSVTYQLNPGFRPQQIVELVAPVDNQFVNPTQTSKVVITGACSDQTLVNFEADVDGTSVASGKVGAGGVFLALWTATPGVHTVQVKCFDNQQHSALSDTRTVRVASSTAISTTTNFPDNTSPQEPHFFSSVEFGAAPFTSPAWVTGTASVSGDASQAVAAMSVGNSATGTLNSAYLSGGTPKNRFWTAKISSLSTNSNADEDNSYATSGVIVSGTSGGGATSKSIPFSPVYYRATDSLGYSVDNLNGTPLPQTSYWAPILLDIGDNGRIALQKGDSILVAGLEGTSTCTAAAGTGVNNSDLLYWGNRYSLLRLKYGIAGADNALSLLTTPDFPDPKFVAQQQSATVDVFDVGFDVAGVSPDAKGNQKVNLDGGDTNGNGIPDSLDDQVSNNNLNLVKLVIRQPNLGTGKPADGSITLKVYAPTAEIGGGNARLLYDPLSIAEPLPNTMLVQLPAAGAINIADIDPVAGKTVYLQGTGWSVAPQDVAVVMEYVPINSNGTPYRWTKTCRDATWFTISPTFGEKFDILADADHDGFITDSDIGAKNTFNGVIMASGFGIPHHPTATDRIPIKLDANLDNGMIVLILDNPYVQVYDAPSGGNLMTFSTLRWTLPQKPPDLLYLQFNTDEVVTLSLLLVQGSGTPPKSDTLKLVRVSNGLGSDSLAPYTSAVPGYANVELTTGNLFISAAASTYHTPLMGPNVVYYYNSLDGLQTPKMNSARGWRSNYDMQIIEGTPDRDNDGKLTEKDRQDGDLLVLIDESGRRFNFTWDSAQHKFASDPKGGLLKATIDPTDGTKYVLIRNDNLFYTFEGKTGLLTSITDLFKDARVHGITIRNEFGAFFAQDDAGTRSETVGIQAFGVSGDLLPQPYGNVISGLSGREIPGMSFSYDTSHSIPLVSGVTINGNFSNPEGNYSCTFDFDNNLRVTAVHLFSQGSVDFTKHILYDGGNVSVGDMLGGETDYQVDAEKDAWTSMRDAGGVTTARTVDASTRRVTGSTMGRYTESMNYDDIGNLTSHAVSGGTSMSYAYSNNGISGANLLMSSTLLGAGGSTSYVYDNHGLPTQITDPCGNVRHLAYDGSGFLSSMTDARSHQWTYSNLSYGKPQNTTSPLGHSTSSIIDAHGLVHSSTDAMSFTTTYDYDSQQRVSAVNGPNGTASTIYDPLGHVLYAKDVVSEKTVTTTYDVIGRPTLINRSGIGPVQMVWDDSGDASSGQLVTSNRVGGADSTDVVRELSITQLDRLGRVASTRFKRTLDASAAPQYVTTYNSYSAGEGWLESTTDPRGNATSYTYDNAGRVVMVTSPMGGTSLTSYKPSGWTDTVTNPDNNVTAYDYDACGRQTSVTNPAGGSVATTYDESGNVLTSAPSAGNPTTYTYDNDNVQSSMTDVLGKVTVTTVDYGAKKATTVVDGNQGRMASATLGTNGFVAQTTVANYGDTTYDHRADGTVVGKQAPARGPVTSSLDAQDRTLQITVPNGNGSASATNSYDPVTGDKKTASSYLNLNSTFTIDPATGQVLSAKDDVSPGQPNQQALTWDENGNVLSYLDGELRPWSQTFDLDNRVKTRTGPDGVEVDFAYTPAGRLFTQTVASTNDTTTYLYDALGNTINIQQPSGKYVATQYDEFGLIQSQTDGTLTTLYVYDPGTRLLTNVYAPGGMTATYSRDDFGRVTDMQDAGGNVTHWDFDDLDRPVQTMYPDLKTEQLVYNPIGGDVTMATDRAQRVSMRSTDLSGRLYQVLFSDTGESASYAYNAAGQVLTEGFNGDASGHAYDKRGRMTSVQQGIASVDYTYYNDNKPKTKSFADNTEMFDYGGSGSNGLLQAMTGIGGSTAFFYDNKSRVMQMQLPNGVARTYGYDGDDRTVATTQYLSGGPSETFNYGYDGSGRTTQATSENSDTAYSYDSAGRLTNETRNGDHAFSHDYGFDDNCNFNSTTRRFISRPKLDFNDNTMPTQAVPGEGLWTVSDQKLNASTEGAANGNATLRLNLGDDLHSQYSVLVHVDPAPLQNGEETQQGITFGDNGQGHYLLAFAISPLDPPVFNFNNRYRLVVEWISADGGAIQVVADSGYGELDSSNYGDQTLNIQLNHTIGGNDSIHASLVDTNFGTELATVDANLDNPSSGNLGLELRGPSAETLIGTFDDFKWVTGTIQNRGYSTNSFNQLTSIDGDDSNALTYNDQGQLTHQVKNGVITDYTYDRLDRLTSIATNDGISTHSSTYSYYGASWMRASATVDGVTTSYVHDGFACMAKMTGGNTTHYTSMGGAPMFETDASSLNTMVYHNDGRGNVGGLIDGTGSIVEKYIHDSYGNFKAFNASGQEIPKTSGPRYRGEFYDADTDQTYLRNRYLSGDTGRFNQTDPIGYSGGNNLYGFCGGDPVNHRDPLGLEEGELVPKPHPGDATESPEEAYEAELAKTDPAAAIRFKEQKELEGKKESQVPVGGGGGSGNSAGSANSAGSSNSAGSGNGGGSGNGAGNSNSGNNADVTTSNLVSRTASEAAAIAGKAATRVAERNPKEPAASNAPLQSGTEPGTSVEPSPDRIKALSQVDPATGKVRPIEAKQAAELEVRLGGQLERYTKPGADFVFISGKYSGKTVDFLLGGMPDKFFNLNSITAQIIRHTAKADIVPIDLRGLSSVNVDALKAFVQTLPEEDQSRIIFIH